MEKRVKGNKGLGEDESKGKRKDKSREKTWGNRKENREHVKEELNGE